MEGFLNFMIKKRPKIKLNYDNANVYAVIEHINTQLDHLKIPKINGTYVNALKLYNIAMQLLQIENGTVTPLMALIFINLLHKEESHIRFWNTLEKTLSDRNSEIHQDVMDRLGLHKNGSSNRLWFVKETEIIKNYITAHFPLIYKYTMIDIYYDDTFIGYWVDPNENTKGMLPEKFHETIHNANTAPLTLSGKILSTMQENQHIFYFKSTKYNDRLTIKV